jgi:hypothetical protein
VAAKAATSQGPGGVTPRVPGELDVESKAAKYLRRVRWGAALAIAVAALLVMGHWLATGSRPFCQVVTDTRQGEPASVTKTCGLPDVADYIYVLAVLGLLLLPDAKSLSFGGLAFERLTQEVKQQASELGQLKQQVSTTINIGAALDREALKAALRDLKANLDELRVILPAGDAANGRLQRFDAVAGRIDEASLIELVYAAGVGYEVLQEVRHLAVARLRESAELSPDDIAEAVDAESLLGELPGQAVASTDPSAGGPAERKVEA